MENPLASTTLPSKVTRRPDGRNCAYYQRYLHARRNWLAWEFLRRNLRFQAACYSVEEGGASPSEVAKQFGLMKFRDFRHSYKRDFTIPLFRYTRGTHVVRDVTRLRTPMGNDFLVRIHPADFDVGMPGFRRKVRTMLREIQSELAHRAPSYSKQLQIKREHMPDLLQLLDLIDAGATDEEVILTVPSLNSRAAEGHLMRLPLKRMKTRAEFMRAQGYKELAVLGHSGSKQTAKRLEQMAQAMTNTTSTSPTNT